MFEAQDRRCDGHRGLPHAVLNSGNVSHVSFPPMQFVNLFLKTIVKSQIPPCAREIRERLTELACPAEDDELVVESIDERVDEPVDDLGDESAQEPSSRKRNNLFRMHAAELMLRRVHANLGHRSKGLMLRPLRDAKAPAECDLKTRRTGAVRPVQVSEQRT